MKSVKVSDYMNRHPVVFTSQLAVEAAVERLLQSRQRGGPVIDAERNVIGFLSEQDCIAALLKGVYHQEQTATVADCMFHPVLTVNEDDAIVDLAERMTLEKPKIYPVLNHSQQLVGIITRTDVLRALDIHLHDGYPKH
ncbi:CBS domain-containing protein [Idiomarina tyrosinivorans]|uniref:CBS domain-containing protein n=1 Tax=Idiomarina tyrosinivorans TaxID=1445662 RepID=A0A432ZU70_9GAMM|nr:CBS domain-containing protein [Idiomarina tyrosinivorans]RUO81382.1 CBS domain-containing protein [Idiomarina tyrosinivorans]